MSKSCFVIMPFGKDKSMQEFYTSVYESIIFPAASKRNYDVNRVDTKQSNIGNITKNIVKDLVYSDLVIADLTEGNANVFYELGIRHALHKCATILIIQAGYEIPFDLKQHVTVIYSTDIRGIQVAIQGIITAIDKSEKARENDADNPVHEYIPSLSFVLSADNEGVLKGEIKRLTEELRNYEDVAEKYGLNIKNELALEEDIEKSLLEADELVNIGGVSALHELRDTAAEGNVEKFELLLKSILKSKLLSEDNYREISRMCNRLNLLPHRIIVLVQGRKQFPKSSSIIGLLADAYSDHPQPQQQQKGRELIENFMHIEYLDSLPVASKYTQDDSYLLMGLFNTYIMQEDWRSIISFCDSAAKIGLEDVSITRNKAKALLEIGNFSAAEESLLAAVVAHPEDDPLQTLLASLYRRTGNYEKALTAREKALLIDPNDPNLYINLTIDILNYGFIHSSVDDILGPIDQKKRLTECYPIMNRALEIDSSPALRIRLNDILTKSKAKKEAEEVLVTRQITTQIKSIEMDYLLTQLNK
jgi:Putative Zn-dependent protease, contains TPR repeats